MFIDTHCHLDFPQFDKDRDRVIQRAKESGVDYILNIGSSLVSSSNSVELADKFDFIYAAVGVHPHDSDKVSTAYWQKLIDLVSFNKVRAIGEVGLDYYRNLSSHETQKKIFKKAIILAKEKNLPLIIHNRQANNDILEILKENMPLRAVIHCFSGDSKFLNECLDLGFFVSFTANITYKNSSALREVVKITPLKRLFLETDAPYLAPQGLRGKNNEPAFVKFVAEEIAKIKNETIEKIALVTSNNAKEFFKL